MLNVNSKTVFRMKYRVKGTKRLTIAFASMEIINHLKENDKCFSLCCKNNRLSNEGKQNENKYTNVHV